MRLSSNESLRLEAQAMDLADEHRLAAEAQRVAHEDVTYEMTRYQQLTVEGKQDLGRRLLKAAGTEGFANVAYKDNLNAGHQFAEDNADGLYELAQDSDENVYGDHVKSNVDQQQSPLTVGIDVDQTR